MLIKFLRRFSKRRRGLQRLITNLEDSLSKTEAYYERHHRLWLTHEALEVRRELDVAQKVLAAAKRL